MQMRIEYNDNEIIGKIEDIKQLFLNRIKEEIDTEELEISEKLVNIGNILDLLNELEKEIINEPIKVFENPMGGFNYYVI